MVGPRSSQPSHSTRACEQHLCRSGWLAEFDCEYFAGSDFCFSHSKQLDTSSLHLCVAHYDRLVYASTGPTHCLMSILNVAGNSHNENPPMPPRVAEQKLLYRSAPVSRCLRTYMQWQSCKPSFFCPCFWCSVFFPVVYKTMYSTSRYLRAQFLI